MPINNDNDNHKYKGNRIINKASDSASKLRDLIKSHRRCEVTPVEYKQIIDRAHADGHIDKEEKALLAEFQAMLSNGTIKRVNG